MKITVIGSTGQLAKCLSDCSWSDVQIEFLSRKECDLENEQSVRLALQGRDSDILINAAAYTNVEGAEDEQERALKINGEGSRILAEEAKRMNALFIHISTDMVFDGEKGEAYTEEDDCRPLSSYARSKRKGEEEVLKVYPEKSIIIRTSWLYSEYGKNFVKTMIRLGKEKDELKVVDDQRGTPTYAGDLARGVQKIVSDFRNSEQALLKHVGLYHFANSDEATWRDLAMEAHRLKGIQIPVHPIATADFPSKVCRPLYTVLKNSKFQKAFSFEIPNWKAALKECVSKLDN